MFIDIYDESSIVAMTVHLQVEFLKILDAIRFKNSFPSEENLIKNTTTASMEPRDRLDKN